MNKLTDMPNIGAKLAELLHLAGIETPEQLQNLGSKQAFLMLLAVTDCACINKLYAIEGAIEGINKKLLPIEIKTELLDFFRSLKKL